MRVAREAVLSARAPCVVVPVRCRACVVVVNAVVPWGPRVFWGCVVALCLGRLGRAEARAR